MSSTNFYYEVDEEKLRVYWENILNRPELVRKIESGVDILTVTMTDGTIVEVPVKVLWDTIGEKPELVKSIEKDGDKLVITSLNGKKLEISLEVLWENISNRPNLIKEITSGEDRLTVTFTDDTTTEIPVSTSSGLKIMQVTEMDVVAPKNVVIPITESPDYMLPPVEVLKQVPGETNKTEVLCDFNAEDAEKFEPNPFVAFDGTMYLKTQETFPSILDETFEGEGYLTVTTIDKNKLGEIVSIEVV